MNLIYYGTCKDINENTIRVEFYANSTSSAKEILLANDAVQVNYEDDNILSPFKKSGASIKMLVPNVMYDLYSPDWLGVKVKILKNNELFWMGYVMPNIYTQPYNDELDEITVECGDTTTMLPDKTIEFADLSEVVIFKDIFFKIFDIINPDKDIKNVCVQQLLTTTTGEDIFDKYGVLARNFFDEELEPATLEDVFEGILYYLNLTLFQWGDAYYLVSLPNLINCAKFNVYDRTTSTKTSATLYVPIMDVSTIGVHQTNGTVSLGDIYDKITVIANINPNNEGIPTPFETDLVNQNSDPEKVYQLPLVAYQDKAYQGVASFWKSKEEWSYRLPSATTGVITEVTDKNYSAITGGTYWTRAASYQITAGTSPANLNFKTYISAIQTDSSIDTEIVKLNKPVFNIYKDGAFIVEMDYLLSDKNLPFNFMATPEYEEHTFTENYMLKFPMRFAIKDKCYYSNYDVFGSWKPYSEYNKKVECGYYFKPVAYNKAQMSDGGKWYKIKRGEYYEYVNQNVYTASSLPKVSGVCNNTDGMCYYFWDENNIRCVVPDDFGLECIWRDKCYLITNFNKDEKILYEEKSLTNTVSWIQKYEDAIEGFMIPAPQDKTLWGELVIDLYTPYELGDYLLGHNQPIPAIHINNFKITYVTPTGKFFDENKADDEDIKYNNVTEDNHSKEYEDIIMIVNTYTPSATSFSYVIDPVNGDVAGKLLNNATNETAIAEEQLVNKFVTHCQTPKIEYVNDLHNKDLKPYSIIKEKNLDKIMIMQAITYNLVADAAEITLKEF